MKHTCTPPSSEVVFLMCLRFGQHFLARPQLLTRV
jgi:hypothetical protein